MTLEAVCSDCDENVTYSWELHIVQDGTKSESNTDSTSGRSLIISLKIADYLNFLHLFYIYFYICSTFVLFVSLFVSFVLHPLF